MRHLAILALLLLGGCAAYQTVDSGSNTVGRLQVEVRGQWTAINNAALSRAGPNTVWTRDGTVLNHLLLYDGLEDGDALFATRGQPAAEYPTFEAHMSESEIADLLTDSVKRFAGANEVRVERLEPRTFAGNPGFSLEFAYTARSELDYRTYAAGAVIDSKLYLILYSAPRLHYYDKDIDAVQRIIASAKVTAT